MEHKYDDVKGRLWSAEMINGELLRHVCSQMSRLHASRREHGLLCARSAAAKVRDHLTRAGQTSLDQARTYFTGQRRYQRLASQASRVGAKLETLDLVAASEVETLSEDRDRLWTELDRSVQEVEALESSGLPDCNYEFAPEPCVLPETYESDLPPSPLGDGDYGIKESWVLKPFDSCGSEELEDLGDTAGSGPLSEQIVEPAEEAPRGLIVGSSG